MKFTSLIENLEFHDLNPYAQPLYADKHGRILRFTLKPGQSIKEHSSPNSPVQIIVLKGHGIFSSCNKNEEHSFSPLSLITFDPGEKHTVKALDEELVFILILHESPDNVSDSNQGLIVGRCN